MKKRILSVLLSVAMALSLLPMAVFAEGTGEEEKLSVTVGGKEMAIGTDGDTVYYTVGSEPFIQGTGNTSVPTDKYAMLDVIGEIAYLTLHNFDLVVEEEAAASSEPLAYAILADFCELVVILEGENNLSGYNNGIVVGEGSLTITAANKAGGILKVTGRSEDEGTAGLSTPALLTIEGKADVEVSLFNQAMVVNEGDVSGIIINDAKVAATGKTNAATSDVWLMAGTLIMRCDGENDARIMPVGTALLAWDDAWYSFDESKPATTPSDGGVIPVHVDPISNYVEVTTISSSPYGLWVSGVPVTSSNAADIFVDGTNGTASYDISNNALNLTNYSNNGTYGPADAAIYYNPDLITTGANGDENTLTIRLLGNSSIKDAGYAILAENAAVTIKDWESDNTVGSLAIFDSYYGIFATGDVTVTSGDVFIESEMNAIYAQGSDAKIAVNGGSLYAHSYGELDTSTNKTFNKDSIFVGATCYYSLNETDTDLTKFEANQGEVTLSVPNNDFVYVTYTNPESEATELWVGGVAVTDANMDDIFGDNPNDSTEVEPTATYDSTNHILTLTNFKCEGFYPLGDAGIYYKGESDLTIKLEGSNTIIGGYYAILSGGGGITIDDGDTEDGTLLITDSAFGIATTAADKGVTIAGGNLFVEAETTAISVTPEVQFTGDDSSKSSARGINISGGTLIANAYGTAGKAFSESPSVTGTYWWTTNMTGEMTESSSNNMFEADNTNFAYITYTNPNADGPSNAPQLTVGNVTIDTTKTASYYDGKVSYDKDTKTLTLNDYTDSNTYEMGKAAILYTGMDDLTINLVGENVFLGGGYAIASEAEGADITIFGDGSLFIANALIGIAALGGDVTIEGGNIFVEAAMNAIYAASADAGDTESTSNIVYKGGELFVHSYGMLNNQAIPALSEALNVEPDAYWWTVSENGDLNVGGHTDYKAENAASPFLYITDSDPSEYGISIGGEVITEGNASNVFGDGKVSYDAATNTLTLRDYTARELSVIDSKTATAWISVSDTVNETLTINLVGNNIMQYAGNETADYGIYVSGAANIKFTGSGTLDMGAKYFGVSAKKGSVTVEGPSVNIVSNIVGILANNIGFTSGNLTANGLNAVDAKTVQMPSTYWWSTDGETFKSGGFDLETGKTNSYLKFTTTNPNPSSSSGGGSPSYSVTTPTASNGSVTLDKTNAKAGDTVKITPKADQGYVVDTVTVKDKDGKTVATTKNADGTYSFKMPAGKVTVEVTFKAEAPVGTGFTDVPSGSYYADPVAWAVTSGITNGLTDTTFGPEVFCTRAHIVTFLWRAHGSPAPSSSVNPFTDLDEDQYYMDAVLWAVEQGITQGMTATTFGPDLTCTRGQAMTFMWRADGQPAGSAANPFHDVNAGAYYEDAVLWGVGEEITNGTSATTFGPEDTCTRGQIVTFLYRDLAQ